MAQAPTLSSAVVGPISAARATAVSVGLRDPQVHARGASRGMLPAAVGSVLPAATPDGHRVLPRARLDPPTMRGSTAFSAVETPHDAIRAPEQRSRRPELSARNVEDVGAAPSRTASLNWEVPTSSIVKMPSAGSAKSNVFGLSLN